MKRIFFVEDDLSLLGGLSFALKSRDMRWRTPGPLPRQNKCGRKAGMIW